MASVGANVKDLLQEHKEAIAEILQKVTKYVEKQDDEGLRNAFDEFPVDEFTVLKYVLTALRRKNKVREVAYERLLETLEFRKKYRDLLIDAKSTKEFQLYLPGVVVGFVGDEFIAVTYFGRTDMNELAKQYGTSEVATLKGYFLSEQTRIVLDKRSRETGRLCKFLCVIDFDGMSLGKAINRTMMSAMGAVSKNNELCTPQLLGRIVAINAPSIFHVLLAASRPFMSKASLEKVCICGGKKGKDYTTCPFLKKHPDIVSAFPDSLN